MKISFTNYIVYIMYVHLLNMVVGFDAFSNNEYRHIDNKQPWQNMKKLQLFSKQSPGNLRRHADQRREFVNAFLVSASVTTSRFLKQSN